MKKYGQELKEELLAQKARVLDIIDRRCQRIDNGEVEDTDCFVSAQLDAMQIREIDMKLAILETEGTAEFDVILDENGREVRTHWFRNHWGRWSVVGRGVYASSVKALCKKTGWSNKTIKAPVWVKLDCGDAKGLMGALMGSYVRCRWHTNMVTGEYVGFPDDRERLKEKEAP